MSAAIALRADAKALAQRIAWQDWERTAASLDASGHAILPGLLDDAECRSIAALYERPEGFRSRVVMARHGFGSGEYRYFAYPLPAAVAMLRTAVYPYLAPVANRWNAAMGLDVRYPEAHADFLQRCHDAGQSRPTPLLLRYDAGDYNCLHQDLYGEHVFPLQMAVLLSQPGTEFEGGEFVLTEQRPRMQSRVEVVPLRRGDAVVFAVHHRPVAGTRGTYRINLRHGVSRVRSGRRHTLGIVFHDAQ
ncbi:2OG-Fe(II) oxygenase [Lysobacter arvi]|uniref:2OG-Fe(II) oxygenase n=1 Tax=Lysobacter arvi TaxID=3038776 RepID=A0ABU1CHA5_9GAMM|nr:2OG-Fe(II) oxygenase [Lysobacter arvi]MDR0184339.1 2OG-Fe(II) oxygenase [Lysobacter arvi]